MARAVSPWLHRVMLRDHGPPDQTMKLCLFIVNAYMDESGCCYPTQEQVAAAACLGVSTVRAKLAAASGLGWLARFEGTRPGQRWKSQTYRAAIPDELDISRHIRKHDLWFASHGEVIPAEALRATLFPKSKAQRERERHRRKGPPPGGGPSASKAERTASARAQDRQLTCEGPPVDDEKDRQQVAPKVPSEVVQGSAQWKGRSHSSQPANAVRALAKDMQAVRADEPLEVRLSKACTLLAESPEFPTDTLCRMFRLTLDQAFEARRSAA